MPWICYREITPQSSFRQELSLQSPPCTNEISSNPLKNRERPAAHLIRNFGRSLAATSMFRTISLVGSEKTCFSIWTLRVDFAVLGEPD